MSKENMRSARAPDNRNTRQAIGVVIGVASLVVTPFVVPLTASLMAVLGIGGVAATAIVSVAWLGAAAVGLIFPAAAPLTSTIQMMISTVGTSGAAAW